MGANAKNLSEPEIRFKNVHTKFEMQGLSLGFVQLAQYVNFIMIYVGSRSWTECIS